MPTKRAPRAAPPERTKATRSEGELIQPTRRRPRGSYASSAPPRSPSARLGKNPAVGDAKRSDDPTTLLRRRHHASHHSQWSYPTRGINAPACARPAPCRPRLPGIRPDARRLHGAANREGIDKFSNTLVNWENYLAPWIHHL